MAIWTVPTGFWQRSAHWPKLLSALVYLGLGRERPEGGRKKLGLGFTVVKESPGGWGLHALWAWSGGCPSFSQSPSNEG